MLVMIMSGRHVLDIGPVRSGKSFCPFCSGYRLSKTNNLAYRHPEIAKYWHPTKNGDRTPENTVSGRFWWQCPHNQDHEWENSISNIVKNTKGICPFCAGRRLECEKQYPDLVADWHPTKNGELKPSDVTAKSGKSVWWKCPKGMIMNGNRLFPEEQLV